MTGSSPTISFDSDGSPPETGRHGAADAVGPGEVAVDRAGDDSLRPDSKSTAASERSATWLVRLVAAGISAGSASLLIVAALLPPDPRGLGTHMFLGFPPCRWVTFAGIPCPTCGMTTSYAHAVRLDVVEAFLAQPFGFLLAIGTAVAFWMGLYVAITGSRAYRCFTSLWRPGFVWSLALLAFLAWIYKIWSYSQGGEIGPW